MASLTILYWRDIPAQIIVKAGRKAAKRELPSRFIEAIDRCAMRTNASAGQDYLDQWRRGEPTECGDDLEAEADAVLARLEAEFDEARLKLLAASGGRVQAERA